MAFCLITKTYIYRNKNNYKYKIRDYNLIKIEAITYKTKWQSALFYSKEYEAYLLPLKLKIIKVENIKEDDLVKIIIKII